MSRVSQQPKRAQPQPKQVQTTEEKTIVSFKPVGEVPKATVLSRHETGTVTRYGRGFSARELSTVGLNFKQARDYGVQADIRRGSLLEANVAGLKSWFQPAKKAPKLEMIPKAAKEKVPKAGKGKVPRPVKEEKVAKIKPVRKTRKTARKKSR